MGRRRRLGIATAGALASVGLSFLPFSTVLGGAVAGLLEGPDPRAGVVVGGLSGLVLLAPAAALGSLGAAAAAYALGWVEAPGGGAGAAVFFGVLIALVFCYTVVLSALGGLVGSWYARARPERREHLLERLGIEDATAELRS